MTKKKMRQKAAVKLRKATGLRLPVAAVIAKAWLRGGRWAVQELTWCGGKAGSPTHEAAQEALAEINKIFCECCGPEWYGKVSGPKATVNIEEVMAPESKAMILRFC